MYLVIYSYKSSDKFWIFHDQESAITHCLKYAEFAGYSFDYSEVLNSLVCEGVFNKFPFTVKKCY